MTGVIVVGGMVVCAVLLLLGPVWCKGHRKEAGKRRNRRSRESAPFFKRLSNPKWTVKVLLAIAFSPLASARTLLLHRRSPSRSLPDPPKPKPQAVSIWGMSEVPEVILAPASESSFVPPSAPTRTYPITPTGTSTKIVARGKGLRSSRVPHTAANTLRATSQSPGAVPVSSLVLARAIKSPPKKQYREVLSRDPFAHVGGCKSIQMIEDTHNIDSVARKAIFGSSCNTRVHGSSLERLREARTKSWVRSVKKENPLYHPLEGLNYGDCGEDYSLLE